MTQVTGAYAVAWDQVQLNGAPGCAEALAPGAVWQWQGDPVRLNGAPDVLVLEAPEDGADLRRRVAIRLGLGESAGSDPDDDELPGDGFVLTDARRRWRGRIVARPGGGELCVFDGGLPPAGVPLWVVSDQSRAPARPRARQARASGVLAGTLVRTPEGAVPIEALYPGDLVLGVDGGWHELLWLGRRPYAGAQLWAHPDLAPVRLLAGALGGGVPSCDLLLAPDTHVALGSARARTLFGAERVLLRARDLLDGGGALRVLARGAVTYVSLAFERHQLVDLAGGGVESYHPLTHDGHSALPDDMARLAAILPESTGDASGFGPPVARCLSAGEAAILRGG